jgi:sulfite exporter TauE/SafE
MDYYFWTALTIGFLGSFHCVGMCGPLAMAVGSGVGTSNLHLKILYNLGRVLTYSALGIVAGLVGKSFSILGFQDDLSVAAGILIILFVLFSNDKVIRFFTGKTVKITSGLRTMLGKLLRKKSPIALTGIGILNGLLPCGFVYLALAGSAAAGSIAGSFGYMVLFGLGTIPMMLGLSIAGSWVSNTIRSQVNRFTPFVAIALAILLIYRGSQVKTVKDCCKPQHHVQSLK